MSHGNSLQAHMFSNIKTFELKIQFEILIYFVLFMRVPDKAYT